MLRVVGFSLALSLVSLSSCTAGEPGDPCDEPSRTCGDWNLGVQFCAFDSAGDESWTSCCVEIIDEETCNVCVAPWEDEEEAINDRCWTPLVLAFANERVELVSAPGATFDLTRDQISVPSDWPTAQTPWLALDRDDNGRIDDGGELFGSATRLSSGGFADNGFEALAELDANCDGVIDRADSAFARLLLWRDANGDRTSEPGELSPAAAELDSIRLGYVSDRLCDARGNCEVERSTFAFRDATGRAREGAVIDVHLRAQP